MFQPKEDFEKIEEQEHVCDCNPEDPESHSEVECFSVIRCKKCGHETICYELPESFFEIAKKINERDSLYEQTWKQIPTSDLIAIARVKTYRATTMLNKNQKEKLLDDLIDAAAYLIFAIEKIREKSM